MAISAASSAASVMANPLTQLALTAVGTGLQIHSQNQMMKAQQDAINAETIRQRGFRDQQNQTADQLMLDQRRNVLEEDIVRNERRFSRENNDRRDRSATLKQALPGGKDGGGPRAVESSGARDAQRREAKSQQISDAFARLGGFRRADMERNVGAADAMAKMRQIGGFARGSASLLPIDMQAAQSAGRGTGVFGDVLVGLGSMGPGLSNGLDSLYGALPKGMRPQGAAGVALPVVKGKRP